MNAYDKGDLVRCSAAYTDSDGAAQDPTAVYFKFKTPSGVTTTYTYLTDSQLERVSAGNYRVDLDANEIGIWSYRFYATGTGQASGEHQFSVKRSEF